MEQLVAVPPFLPAFSSRLGWPFAFALALVGLFGGLRSALKLGPARQESVAFDLGQRFAVDQGAADLEVRGNPANQHLAEVPAQIESLHFILLEGGNRLHFDDIIAKAAIGDLRVILVQPDAVSDRAILFADVAIDLKMTTGPTKIMLRGAEKVLEDRREGQVGIREAGTQLSLLILIIQLIPADLFAIVPYRIVRSQHAAIP